MTAAMNLVMKASEPTDTELVRRLVDGDKEAFAELYQRRHANIYRFALHMSGRPEMADDVAQETFMVLINKSAVYDETKGAVNSFLLGIARNLTLKHWRAEHRFEPLDDEDAVAAPPLDLERGDIGDAVGRAVRALRPLQREVVILAEYEGLTLAEIARAVDADVGTVKSRLHRARENLRRMLASLRSRQPTTT